MTASSLPNLYGNTNIRTRGTNFFAKALEDKPERKAGFLESALNVGAGAFDKGSQRMAGDGLDDYYRALAKRPFGGGKTSGRSETLADGSLTALYPDSFEPIIFPGGGGGGQSRNKVGGALSGAASGFQAGAATGMPHLAGIGAVAGALGGLFG